MRSRNESRCGPVLRSSHRYGDAAPVRPSWPGVLAGVAAPSLDLDTGKRLGTLLGSTSSSDVVDAHVASLVRAGDRVLTSDPDDLRILLDVLAVKADLIRV